MSVVYKLLNPPVKRLLRSGLHGLMSKNTLLLEFTGRKSGRALSTPISYYLKDGATPCLSNRTPAALASLGTACKKRFSSAAITAWSSVSTCGMLAMRRPRIVR